MDGWHQNPIWNYLGPADTWVRANAVGISVYRADDVDIRDSFVLGTSVGLYTGESAADGRLPGGSAWLTATALKFDQVVNPIRVAQTQGAYVGPGSSVGVSITNLKCIGSTGKEVETQSTFTGTLTITNAQMGTEITGATPTHNFYLRGTGVVIVSNVYARAATTKQIDAASSGTLTVRFGEFVSKYTGAFPVLIGAGVTGGISGSDFGTASAIDASAATLAFMRRGNTGAGVALGDGP